MNPFHSSLARIQTDLQPNWGKFERGDLRAIAIEKIEIINRPADSKFPAL